MLSLDRGRGCRALFQQNRYSYRHFYASTRALRSSISYHRLILLLILLRLFRSSVRIGCALARPLSRETNRARSTCFCVNLYSKSESYVTAIFRRQRENGRDILFIWPMDSGMAYALNRSSAQDDGKPNDEFSVPRPCSRITHTCMRRLK